MNLLINEILRQRFWDLIADYPDPELLRVRFERLIRANQSIESILQVGQEYELSALKHLLTLGEAVVDELVRFPHFLRLHLTPGYLRDIFSETPSPARDLGTFKRFVWLRIILRDRLGLVPLEETLSDLSRLADHCVREAFAQSLPFALCPLPSTPSPLPFALSPMPFNVDLWALGKWGALELNASSDLDAVFFTNSSDPSVDTDRMVRNWLQVMMPINTPPVYPIDLRLRPEGPSGPLVCSYPAAERYFFERAAPWERIAYLRARQVIGTSPPSFRELLDAFLYPPGISPLDRIQEIFQMLEGIHRSAKPRDIKREPGGIRDIEFLVHGLQLLHGRSIPLLRRGAILDLLPLLGKEGILPGADVIALENGYRFFRRVENALQAEEDRAVFVVPEPGSLRHARLAYALGESPEQFERLLHHNCENVKKIIERELSVNQGRSFAGILLADPQPDIDYEKGKGVLRRLSGRWGDARSLFDSEVINRAPDLEETFARLESAVGSYGGAAAWATTFSQREEVRRDATRLITYSKLLTGEAIARPYLWDRIGRRELPEPWCLPPAADASNSDADIHAVNRYLGDLLYQMGVLLFFGEMKTEHAFTAWNQAIDEMIAPRFDLLNQTNKPPLTLIGIGKWGSQELAPTGDLDFIAVSEACSPNELGEAQHCVAQWRKTMETGGRLVLDDRLRPEGSSSPLVITLGRLESYLTARAEIWEAVAYSRARFVAGDPEIGTRAIELLEGFCTIPPKTSQWAAIHRARKRVASETKSRPGAVNIKKSRGGMMDFEFAVVFAGWKLAIPSGEWWHQPMHLRMENLAQLDDSIDWMAAREAYQTLRTWDLASFFSNGAKKHELPLDGVEADRLREWLSPDLPPLDQIWKDIAEMGRSLYEVCSD